MRVTHKIVLQPTNRKSGAYAVFLRLSYAGKSKYFHLNRKAQPEQWDKAAGRFRRSFPNWRTENEVLAAYESRAADTLREIERNAQTFTFERFGRLFAGQSDGASIRIADYCTETAGRVKAEGRFGNAGVYRDLGRVIARYRSGATLPDVDAGFLGGLARHFRERGAVGSVHFRTLRALCGRAIRDELMPKGWAPFEGFEIPKTKRKAGKRALSLDVIRHLEAIEFTDKRIGAYSRLVRDLFLFSFYCRGMNLVDIAALRSENVAEGRLLYRRAKTGREYSVRLNERATAILARYSGHSDGGYLFPIYGKGHKTEDEKKMRRHNIMRRINRYIRAFVTSLGLSALDVSFYSARHTYATELKRKGVGLSIIKEALGHADQRTTEGYLKRFDEEVDRADELLD
jgi:integrase/recombinase XerD